MRPKLFIKIRCFKMQVDLTEIIQPVILIFTNKMPIPFHSFAQLQPIKSLLTIQMSILTFGNTVAVKTSASLTASEELVDEMLQASLELAFKLKQDGRFSEAAAKYEKLLMESALKDSRVIEKHLFMRFNIHKNLGEIYGALQRQSEAKKQFSEALKIQPRDAFCWTRLGYIEYHNYRSLGLSRKCFEAAIKTLPVLEKRRGETMNPILKKLAEIYIQEFQYQQGEQVVDVLLTRTTAHDDSKHHLFAILCKAYFTLLSPAENAEQDYSALMLRAHQINPSAAICKLSVFNRLPRMCNRITAQEYFEIKAGEIEESKTIQTFWRASLTAIQQAVTQVVNGRREHETLIDTTWLKQALEQKLNSTNRSSFLAPVSSASANEAQLYSEEQHPIVNEKQRTETSAPAQGGARHHQRKRDQAMDQLMRNLHLERLNLYLTHVYNSFGERLPQIAGTKMILFAAEAFAKANISQQSARVHAAPSAESHVVSELQLDAVQTVLQLIHNKNVIRASKIVLQLCCEWGLLDEDLAIVAFKIYQATLRAQGDLKDFGDSGTLLTCFELTLFNSQVISQTKSGPIMTYRNQLYDYFYSNLRDVISAWNGNSSGNLSQCQDLRTRLCYAMMYYAFEVKNDMSSAVQYYKMLDKEWLYARGQPLKLAWAGNAFHIDAQLVTAFGEHKISEAQNVKATDEAILQLKQSEFETCKTEYRRLECPLSTVLHCLDQLFNCLKTYLRSLELSGATASAECATDQAPKSNSAAMQQLRQLEERAKDIWEKLCFCLVRVRSSDFYRVLNQLFCIIAGFQSREVQLSASGNSLNDCFVLRRFDFELIVSEVAARARALVSDNIIQTVSSFGELKSLVSKELQVEMSGSKTQSEEESFDLLSKIHVHLLRFFRVDFLAINVRNGGSSGSNLGDPGQKFITSAMQAVFAVELLRSALSGSLDSVALLMRGFDQIAQENCEFMMRAYSKLFAHSLPALIHFQREQCLGELVDDMLGLLTGVRLLNGQEKVAENEQKNDGCLNLDQEFEETELSFLAGFRPPKIQQKFSLPNPKFWLKEIIVARKELDVHLMADLVKAVDDRFGGRWLTWEAPMTLLDLKQGARLVETLTSILLLRKIELQKRNQTAKQLVEQQIQSDEPFNLQLPGCAGSFSEDLATVLKLIFKFHNCISGQQAFEHKQGKNFGLSVPKRALLIQREFPSFDQKKKIISLTSLGLQYNACPYECLITRSYLEYNLYCIALDTKCLVSFRKNPDYLAYKSNKHPACRFALLALETAVATSNVDQCNEALFQLVSINYGRLIAKRTRNTEFTTTLIKTVEFLAQIAECTRSLSQRASSDPRLRTIPFEQLQTCALSIFGAFNRSVQQTYKEQKNVKMIISTPQIFNCIEQMTLACNFLHNVTKSVSPQLIEQPPWEFSFIQAQLQSYGSHSQIILLNRALQLSINQQKASAAYECVLQQLDSCLTATIDFKYDIQSQNTHQWDQQHLENTIQEMLNNLENFLQSQHDQQQENETGICAELKYLVHQHQTSEYLRGQIYKYCTTNIRPAGDRLHALLTRAYSLVDIAITLLAEPTTKSAPESVGCQWMQIRLQFLTQNCIFKELRQLYTGQNPKLSQQQTPMAAKLLREQLFQIHKEALSLEEKLSQLKQSLGESVHPGTRQFLMRSHSLPNDMEHEGTFLPSFVHFGSAITIQAFLISLRSCLINVCSVAQDYEPLLGLFRRYMEIYRKNFSEKGSITQASSHQQCIDMPNDVYDLSNQSRDALFPTLLIYCKREWETFKILRESYLQFERQLPAASSTSFTESCQAFQDFQVKYQMSQTQMPPLLRDVLELYLDCHYQKAFFRKNNLVTELHKIQVRESLLIACALAGPDPELTPGSLRLLDWNLLLTEDYQMQGVCQCLRWCYGILEQMNKKHGKKAVDTLKKIGFVLEELKVLSTVVAQNQYDDLQKQ